METIQSLKQGQLTMKAIVYTQYGGPEVLQVKEVAKPKPKPKEVLVKVHASTVTAADSFIRRGVPYIGRLFIGLFKPKYPITGTGFAGKVVAVGEEVSDYKPGDRVFGESVFGAGTNAEYICIPEDGLILPIPEGLSYEQVASMSDGPLTSINFLKKQANIQTGQRIMIIGASGSLGTAAVQLAKQYGAEVVGVCSGRNAALVRSLGADEVIDYTQEDYTQREEQYDIIYDTVGKSSFSMTRHLLTEQGIYMSPAANFGLMMQVVWTALFSTKKAKFSSTGILPKEVLLPFLEELRSLMAKEKLRTVIDKRYPLAEISEAHRYVETGRKKGNVVIVA